MEILSNLRTQEEILLKFYEKLTNENYTNSLKKSVINYHKTMTALSTLKNVNELIESYYINIDKDISRGEELNKVFGLLQGLFVSIDSLYELSRGISKNKWSININDNKCLQQIKFIRNDVVGHPSFRHYSKSDIGFCNLNLNQTNMYNISYQVCTINHNDTIEEHREVDVLRILESYYIESNKALNVVFNKLDYEITCVNTDLSLCLTDAVYKLFHYYKNKEDYLGQINNIKKSYLKMNNLKEDDLDKFIWRMNLIMKLFLWKEESSKKIETLKYLTFVQIQKLHSMCIQHDKDHNIRFEYSKLPKFNLPVYLEHYLNFKQRKLSNKTHILNNIHESNSPLFKASINKLLLLSKSNAVTYELFSWLLSLSKESREKVYLLGNQIKNT